jgi:hypothetical protein
MQRTKKFRETCSDSLLTGVLVMVVVGACRVARLGTLRTLVAACRALPRAFTWWAAMHFGEAVLCWAVAAGHAVLGVAVLLGAPWLVYRSGLLSDYHSMPVTRLAGGLGLCCGAAGYLAIGGVGGDPRVWLVLWEVWTALHIAASSAAHRVCMWSIQASAEAGGGGGGGGGPGGRAAEAEKLYEDSLGWLPAAMWLGLGVMLPALTATLPFALKGAA